MSEEAQNRMRNRGKTVELENTENEVELINPKGEHIRWIFTKYFDGEYYASMFVIEEYPEPHQQLIKEHSLGKDEARARRLWNSIIRHRRDLNVSETVSIDKKTVRVEREK